MKKLILLTVLSFMACTANAVPLINLNINECLFQNEVNTATNYIRTTDCLVTYTTDINGVRARNKAVLVYSSNAVDLDYIPNISFNKLRGSGASQSDYPSATWTDSTDICVITHTNHGNGFVSTNITYDWNQSYDVVYDAVANTFTMTHIIDCRM